MNPSEPILLSYTKNLLSTLGSMNLEEIRVLLLKFFTPRNALHAFCEGVCFIILSPFKLLSFPYYMIKFRTTSMMFKSKENLNCKGTPESGPSTNVTKSLCSFLMLLLPLTLLLVLFNFLYGVIATVCSIPMLLIALILLPFTKCCLPTANQLYSEGNLDHNSSLTDSDSCCSTASTEYSFAANQEEIQEEEDAVLNSTDMLRCTTSHPLGTNALIGL